MPFEPAPKTEQEDRVAMGRIALEAIAAHILTVPPEKFDMGLWCGTAQCAIGNSIHLPEVVATGLYLAPALPGMSHEQSHFPAFQGRMHDFDSIAAAFGVPYRAATLMFRGHHGTNTTPEQVSTTIRDYLANGIDADEEVPF